jgi:hypothetical protein
MVLGDMPNDFGHLHFTTDEKNEIIKDFPKANYLFKKVIGSQEFIKGIERWCLWIKNDDIEFSESIPEIARRISLVRKERSQSKKLSYNKYAEMPHRFIEIRTQSVEALIIPGTSSENREYLPIGFVDSNVIINNLAFAIYGQYTFLFSIIGSKMHNVWLKAVGGSLETRIRYSSVLCYNTFPFPPISESQKQELEKHVYRILEEREKHSEKTLAQLYDPDKMPDGLKEAHHQNDLAIERCYRSKPFESDEERLEYLFKMYEQMIEEEKTKRTLFATGGKSRPLIKRIK